MEKVKEKQATNYFIYFAAFATSSIAFACGSGYSWTSPFLPKFASYDPAINPISRPLTTSEAGLMVSIINLGLFVGPIIPSLAIGIFGKKKTLLLAAIPIFTGHIICMFAGTIELFLVARFLMGLTAGAIWPAVPAYLGEVCEPRIRGFCSSLVAIMNTSGGLFCLCTGPYLSMKWFSLLQLLPVTVYLVSVFFFVPESPYDLIMKDSLRKAEESLIILRRRTDVQVELSQIKKSIEADQEKKGRFVDIFKDDTIFTAVRVCTILMVINGCSGVCVILGYSQTIFDSAGSSIPSEYSAMIIISVGIFATIMSTYLVDIMGRKILLISSCLMVFISYVAIGAFFFVQQRGGQISSLGWLPISSLILFMMGFYFGLASVPFVFIGEMFPSHVKAVASSFCSSVDFFLYFTVTLSYSYLVECIGIAFTFWFFAIFMGLGVVYCIIFVPETKGKTLQEIGLMLNKKF